MTNHINVLNALQDAGYKAGEITSNTFVYINDEGEYSAMEKPDTQSFPADGRGDFGAYVTAFQWENESTLSKIERGKGGWQGAVKQNVYKANKALEEINREKPKRRPSFLLRFPDQESKAGAEKIASRLGYTLTDYIVAAIEHYNKSWGVNQKND